MAYAHCVHQMTTNVTFLFNKVAITALTPAFGS